MTDAEFEAYIAKFEKTETPAEFCANKLLPSHPHSQHPSSLTPSQSQALAHAAQQLSADQVRQTYKDLANSDALLSRVIQLARNHGLDLWIGFEQAISFRYIAQEELARQLLGLSMPRQNHSLFFPDGHELNLPTVLVVRVQKDSTSSIEAFEAELNSEEFQIATGVLYGPKSPWTVMPLYEAGDHMQYLEQSLGSHNMSPELTH